MRKLQITILDLVAKGPTGKLFHRIMNANLASIMPQAIAVWCEALGHDVRFVCYTGADVGKAPGMIFPMNLTKGPCASTGRKSPMDAPVLGKRAANFHSDNEQLGQLAGFFLASPLAVLLDLRILSIQILGGMLPMLLGPTIWPSLLLP